MKHLLKAIKWAALACVVWLVGGVGYLSVTLAWDWYHSPERAHSLAMIERGELKRTSALDYIIY